MSSNRRASIFKIILALFALYCFITIVRMIVMHQVSRNLEWCERSLSISNCRLNVEPSVWEPIEDAHGIVESKINLDKIKNITKCLDKPMEPIIHQKGPYWVLYNYIRAEKNFGCHESITYTTHGDYTFLDNLIPLVERWRGPISIALYAPGTDFKNTLDSIAYLRDCTCSMVKDYVTFHIYFSAKHIPKEVPRPDDVLTEPYNCQLVPPFIKMTRDQMYKTKKNLLYPVNVGRNVARRMAQTHYVLVSDIELYPSPDLISQFLAMIADNTDPALSKTPKVFPLHLFEVSADQQIPENKSKLKEMLADETAIPFHKNLCAYCHGIPEAEEWQMADQTKDMKVFNVAKREGEFSRWEPIFIGTNSEPLYDERFSWEGKRDKMTQGYSLCVLDYNFLILNNAFLVHKPGIKVKKKDRKRDALWKKTKQLINETIFPELKILYGFKEGCVV